MDLLAAAVRFAIGALLFGGSIVISCAIGFSLFPATKRTWQLGSSLVLLALLNLVSFHKFAVEAPIVYVLVVLVSCAVLTMRLLDTTNSMSFNVIRSGMFILIGVLGVLHLGALVFLAGMWLIGR
ncbi:MAG: hypothetical protein KF905_10395 [Flavobacteriales bacterium]|nr:hypothetical protein [Flavobacteriales bacterium]